MTKQFALQQLSRALSRPHLALLAVVLLGLLLRIAYAAAIYEPSLLAYGLDDYILYRVGAELIAQGDLSFSHDLFLLRPPLFSLLVAALNMNDFAVIAANILLGTSVIPLTWMLARMLRLSPRRSLLPAFLVALDPTSIKYAGVLLAEPLANVLLACAFVCALATRDSQQGKTAILWGWLAGGCLILSAFARPAAYMLWLPMALWLLANIRSRGGGGGSVAARPGFAAAAGHWALAKSWTGNIWTQHFFYGWQLESALCAGGIGQASSHAARYRRGLCRIGAAGRSAAGQ